MARNSLLTRSIKLFLSKCFAGLSSLIILIIYSRSLPKAQYGEYQKLLMMISIASTLSIIGIVSILSTYTFEKLESHFINILKRFLPYLLVSVALSLIYFFFSVGVNDLQSEIFTLVIIFLTAALSLQELLIIKKKKETALIKYNALYGLFFIISQWIILPYYTLSLNISVLLLLSIFKNLLFYFGSNRSYFKIRDNVKPHVNIREYLLLAANQGIQLLTKWLDKIFLFYLITTAEFAIYFNGSIEIPFLTIFVASANFIIIDTLNQQYPFDKENFLRALNEKCIFGASLVYPCIVFTIIFRSDLFTFLLSDKYAASANIYLIYSTIFFLRITSFTAILQAQEKANYIFKGALIDIAFNIICIPLFYKLIGLEGVALSIVVGTYLQCGYYTYHSAKLLNTSILKLYPFKRLMFIAGISFIILYAVYVVSKLFIVSQLFLLLTGFVALIGLLFLFNRHYILEVVKSKKIKN